jgi:gliding motility-associated-like protein
MSSKKSMLQFLSGLATPGLLSAALALLLQVLPTGASAQYTKLHDFGDRLNGSLPFSAPVSDGTFLYGMTSAGGTDDDGTIYKIKPDGTGYLKLLDFGDVADGSEPHGALFFDGTFLYGMTKGGGDEGHGTIFKILPDGTGYSKLLDFAYLTSGAFPYGSLISDGTFLYGMTTQGGSGSYGTLFKIKTDGTGFAVLLNFIDTNGSNAFGTPFYDGTYLYGMTSTGGTSSRGTLFRIKPDGSGYLRLLNFNGIGNGSSPYGSVFSDGTFLYGMTISGGANNRGTIFKIGPDGAGFSKLFDFTTGVATGGSPTGSLVSDGTFLYGATADFGANSRGTIFKIKTDGTGFVKLLDNDIGTYGLSAEGTLIFVGTTLYGVKSGYSNGAAPFYSGSMYKINTDGSGYAKLVSFNITGEHPLGSLVLAGGFLYGTTSDGGLLGGGTIFKIKPDGTSYAKVLDFDRITNGSNPVGRLIFDGTFFYGLTNSGGAHDNGTVFKILPDGTGYVKLFDFDFATTGNSPTGSLIYDGTFLYGTTYLGGTNHNGTVFKIKTDGTGYLKLIDFDEFNQGSNPKGSLISDGIFLYGLASGGGVNGSWGTVFKVKLDGSGFAKLYDFDVNDPTSGGIPTGSLVLTGSVLYGMTSSGGQHSGGIIFKINTSGTGFSKLLDFDDRKTGSFPYGSLTLGGAFFYGMTSQGGGIGNGTLFRIKPDGTGFSKLLDFNDGSSAQASLISDGTFLYGLTQNGGDFGGGILFKSTLSPFVSVTNFSPGLGVEGTYVTIYGTGFDPTAANNTVKFNGTTATVISGSADSLAVIVPVGAASGPVSVTAGTTGTSLDDFDVTTVSYMFDGKVKNCNTTFQGFGSGGNDYEETFLPVNPTDKVTVSFVSFAVGDQLSVYDGPTSASPLIVHLSGTSLPADIIATGPGGELTFVFTWEDGTSAWEADINCASVAGPPITISPQPADFAICPGGMATFTTGASGTTNIIYQWQFATTLTGSFSDIANVSGYSNTTTATLSVNTAGNFGAGFYRAKVNGDLATTAFSNAAQLTIAAPPAPPTTNGVSFCGGTSATLTASGGTNGQYNWYSDATGGPPIAGQNNDSFTTPVLTATTPYYVSLVIGGCESTRTLAIAATILTGACDDIVVYNGISPNGDNKNPIWYIKNISVVQETKINHVTIYNRWGDPVFEVDDYDNANVVFDGHNKNGGELPSGIYFYAISFSSGRKTLTGYLSLRR